MTTLYLDTSALIKLYVDEEESEGVHGAVDEATRVMTSTIAYAELRSALARRRRLGDLGEEAHRRAVTRIDEDWHGLSKLAVSNLLARRAGEMAERYALRGFDAIHLASAARLREGFADLHFLAFDARLLAATRASAVPVFEGT